MVLSVVVLVVWLLLGIGMFLWGRGETLRAPLQALDGDLSGHTTLSLDIVVPARDEASVISRCIEPIVAGMESGVSLVVVDDGSSDRTAKIATMAIGSANGSVVPAPDKPIGWAGNSGVDSIFGCRCVRRSTGAQGCDRRGRCARPFHALSIWNLGDPDDATCSGVASAGVGGARQPRFT